METVVPLSQYIQKQVQLGRRMNQKGLIWTGLNPAQLELAAAFEPHEVSHPAKRLNLDSTENEDNPAGKDFEQRGLFPGVRNTPREASAMLFHAEKVVNTALLVLPNICRDRSGAGRAAEMTAAGLQSRPVRLADGRLDRCAAGLEFSVEFFRRREASRVRSG